MGFLYYAARMGPRVLGLAGKVMDLLLGSYLLLGDYLLLRGLFFAEGTRGKVAKAVYLGYLYCLYFT